MSDPSNQRLPARRRRTSVSTQTPETDPRWIRIADGVLINVCSAISLTIIGGVFSGLALFAQWVFHFVVIPTHILTVLAFLGVGMFIMLIIVVGLVSLGYFWFQKKHPILLLGMFFGLLFALLFESKGGLAPVSEIWEQAKTSAASPAATTGGGNTP